MPVPDARSYDFDQDWRFVLVNADVYCEYDYSRLMDVSLREKLGHIVMVANPPHRPQGDFSLQAGLVGNGAAPRYTYAGIALMSVKLVEHIHAGDKVALAPLLRDAAERELLGGERYEGLWQDVGTLERLSELESVLASRDER